MKPSVQTLSRICQTLLNILLSAADAQDETQSAVILRALLFVGVSKRYKCYAKAD